MIILFDPDYIPSGALNDAVGPGVATVPVAGLKDHGHCLIYEIHEPGDSPRFLEAFFAVPVEPDCDCNENCPCKES